MLDVTISNTCQQWKLRLRADQFVLARALSEQPMWYVAPRGTQLNAAGQIEVIESTDAVQLRLTGVGDSFADDLSTKPLPLPVEFEFEGTRFEFSASATAQSPQRRRLLDRIFPSAVVDQLAQDPHALAGREREVTVLFADLRNFSSTCAMLDTRASYELLNEMMDSLTAAVMDHDGVVIDYYGDGLAAMWNAPLEQPHHAELACRAGLQMLSSLPSVNATWGSRLPRELRLGIGVHTGVAQVGNVGSRQRIKYGPRGATVNLASRVEAATKKLRVPMLVTGSTAEQLSGELLTYRACQAQLPGVSAPVDLFAVAPPSTADRLAHNLERYESVLQMYELGQLEEAEVLLAGGSALGPDVPGRFLAEHIRDCRKQQIGRRSTDESPSVHSPVIALDVK